MTGKRHRMAGQRGAALLLAMIILTLIATLAASMVWQQSRAIQVEATEGSRSQAAWIITGALDWARLILREDNKNGSKQVDHLGEPWAVPLAEARLSSFLAADKNNNAEDTGPDAFLSGVITDAQAKFNLSNLAALPDGKPPTAWIAKFKKLCESVNVPDSTAERIITGLGAAQGQGADVAIPPRTAEQLAWLGVDAADIKRLEPFVILLEQAGKTVNVNTASAEVLAAVLEIDRSSAQRLVQTRQRDPFESLQNALAAIGQDQRAAELQNFAGVQSNFFEVQGQVRLGDRVLRETSLLRREGQEVTLVRRQRVNLVSTGS